MEQIKKHPWTTLAGLLIIILVSIDVIRNGIHTENVAMAVAAIGLLKASDSKTKEVEE